MNISHSTHQSPYFSSNLAIQTTDQPINQPINHPVYVSEESKMLFKYQFVLQLVIQYLHDRDVLCSMLLTGKEMKHFLINYPVKKRVKQKHALLYSSSDRYLPVSSFTHIEEITSPNLIKFSSLTSADFAYRFNRHISPEMLPRSLKHITINGFHDRVVYPGMFPEKLETLKVGGYYNQIISPDALPDSLGALRLSDHNQPFVTGCLPHSLVSLEIISLIKHVIFPGMLPHTLRSLKISYTPHLEPNVLPPHLDTLHLWLGTPLTQGVLPLAVRHLILSGHGQLLKPGMLPDVLETLDIGSSILPAPHTLPLSLIYLKMYVDEPVMPDIFPLALESLQCMSDLRFPPLEIPAGVLPKSLKSLVVLRLVSLERGSLPSQLCSIRILTNGFGELKPGWLPSSLRSLSLFHHLLHEVGVVPYGVTELEIGSHVSVPLSPGHIPSSVQRLILWNRGRGHSSVQLGSIPDSVTELYTKVSIGKNIIPLSVTHLMVDFNTKILAGVIPSSVTHLRLGSKHRNTIPNGSIPASVTHMSFYGSGNQLKDLSFIPTSVKYLEMRFVRTGRTIVLPSTVQHLWLPYANRNQPPKMTNVPSRLSYSAMSGWPNKLPDYWQ